MVSGCLSPPDAAWRDGAIAQPATQWVPTIEDVAHHFLLEFRSRRLLGGSVHERSDSLGLVKMDRDLTFCTWPELNRQIAALQSLW